MTHPDSSAEEIKEVRGCDSLQHPAKLHHVTLGHRKRYVRTVLNLKCPSTRVADLAYMPILHAT